MVSAKVTFDLHGKSFGGGDDEASIIFIQNGDWRAANVTLFGAQNGLNGSQIVTIPLTSFHKVGNASIKLDPSQPVSNLHARFWNSGSFTVDITSVKLIGSGVGSTPTPTPTATPTPTPTSTPSPTPTPTPTPILSSVYTGQYFDNKTLTGSPKLTRNDQTINFDWGGGSPDPLIPIDNFSVRWTKTETFVAGSYKFSMTGDDGVRLYIDNVLVIDKWIDQGASTYTTTKTLSAGSHTIKMEYYESGGGAVAKLSYKQIIPYSGQYFDNKTLTGTPKLTRTDEVINFNWGSGSPDPLIPSDNFSVRWTKTETFVAGSYKFSMTGDDGVRLYIDNVLVIDKWIDQGATTYTTTKTLSAGSHTIKMEYYENGGGAVAKLSY